MNETVVFAGTGVKVSVRETDDTVDHEVRVRKTWRVRSHCTRAERDEVALKVARLIVGYTHARRDKYTVPEAAAALLADEAALAADRDRMLRQSSSVVAGGVVWYVHRQEVASGLVETLVRAGGVRA